MKLRDHFRMIRGNLVHRHNEKIAGNKRKRYNPDVRFQGVVYNLEELKILYAQETPEGLDTKAPVVTFSNYPAIIYSEDGVHPYALVGAIITKKGQQATQWAYDGTCITQDPDHKLVNKESFNDEINF